MTKSTPSETTPGDGAEAPHGNPRQAEPISVHVACDHEIIRKSLAALLNCHRDLQVVETSPQGMRGVKAAQRSMPQVLLLAIPISEDAARHLEWYRSVVPAARIVGFCLSRAQADAYRRAGIEVIYSHGTASELSAAIKRASEPVADQESTRPTPGSFHHD